MGARLMAAPDWQDVARRQYMRVQMVIVVASLCGGYFVAVELDRMLLRSTTWWAEWRSSWIVQYPGGALYFAASLAFGFLLNRLIHAGIPRPSGG